MSVPLGAWGAWVRAAGGGRLVGGHGVDRERDWTWQVPLVSTVLLGPAGFFSGSFFTGVAADCGDSCGRLYLPRCSDALLTSGCTLSAAAVTAHIISKFDDIEGGVGEHGLPGRFRRDTLRILQ